MANKALQLVVSSQSYLWRGAGVCGNREDEEAFYAYVDKLHTEATWIEMPALESVEDLENYPEFINHLRKGAEPRDNAV